MLGILERDRGLPSRVLPVWLISTLVGVAVISPIVAYLALRHPPARAPSPPAVVVSVCRDLAPGMRRAARDLDIKFDVPESRLVLDCGGHCWSDSPLPGHDLTLKSHRSIFMTMSRWSQDQADIDRDLVRWTLFSEHAEQRDVRSVNGDVVGKDHWGIWKDHERWRLVIFDSGEWAEYRPTPNKEAQLFDQVISSACFSAGRGD